MLRIFALLLALVSVGCMSVAIIGMVTGRPGDRAGLGAAARGGGVLRAAVALNVAAH